MNEQSQVPTCSRCGAPMPADALKGLCPRCLMELNLSAPTEIPGETVPLGPGASRPLPSLEEIAKQFPQFEILECLGRGGMGVVYKARQPKLNRVVALKILAPEKEADPKFAERFQREAQALARLNHPNIVTVYDFGETDGLYYLTMEFADGVSLRRLLETRKIEPEEALAIVPKICEALQYAHDEGVVHRDIKPENILLDKKGRVKIADFGIAKILAGDGGAGSPLPTEAGQPRGGAQGTTSPAAGFTQDQVLGTPNYMAPEQKEHPQKVDHRADIYSLGVVFYEMLTGELPIGKFQPPSKKVHVDVRLDEVVLHTLEKEPERRCQQASQVKTAVETIAQTPAPPAVSSPPVAEPAMNAWQPAILVVAVLFTLAGLLVGLSVPHPVGSVLSVVAGLLMLIALIKLAGLWPFPSPVFPKSNFTGRNLRRFQAPPSPPAPGAEAKLEAVRRQVQAPAIGLFFVGSLNLGLAVAMLMGSLYIAANRGELRSAAIGSVAVITLIGYGATLLGASRMRRLASYGLAITAALCAMILPLGLVIGLPVGIWALFVLSQREVREAFRKARALPPEAAQVKRGGWAPQAALTGVIALVVALVALQWTIGLPQIGRFLVRTRFLRALPHSVPQADAAFRAAASFGPIIERVVSQLDADGEGFVFFDLETGRMSKPPFPLLLRSRSGFNWAEETPELSQWVGTNGFDFLFRLEDKRWSCKGLDLKPTKGTNTFEPDFERISTNEVTFAAADDLQGAVHHTATVLNLRYDDKIHFTMGLITREGTMALLQYAGINTTPRGVKLRYRLAQKTEPYPAEEVVDLGGGVKMEFVLIPAGSFKMGGAWADEAPAHKVTLTKPFYLGKYEVTQEQWDSVMETNRSHAKGPKLPVANVSWEDAQEFIKKLGEKTGRKFALPTEAQWEYACRAGTTSAYSFGDSEADLEDYAWFADNADGFPHPVGERKPNPWGLYDMHGNVWERCSDTFGAYRASSARDPKRTSSDSFHIIRGGGWTTQANGLRCSNRNSDTRGAAHLGLRCVMLADETAGAASRRKPEAVQTPSSFSSTLSSAAIGRKAAGPHRKFVRLVVDQEGMTFEGQPTTWDGVGALMEKVRERKNTVLEFAVTSDRITVQQKYEWFGRCVALANTLGFEYASSIGIKPLRSKGTPGTDSQIRADIDDDLPLAEGVRRANEQWPDAQPLTEEEVIAAVQDLKHKCPKIPDAAYRVYQRIPNERVLPRGMYFSHISTLLKDNGYVNVDWKDLTLDFERADIWGFEPGTIFIYRIRARFISSQLRSTAAVKRTREQMRVAEEAGRTNKLARRAKE